MRYRLEILRVAVGLCLLGSVGSALAADFMLRSPIPGSKEPPATEADLPPGIQSLSPAFGSESGSDSITVSGRKFKLGAQVYFGGALAPNTVFVDASTLMTTTPAHAPGAVDVTVKNPSGKQATAAGAFTYNADPTEQSIEYGFETSTSPKFQLISNPDPYVYDWERVTAVYGTSIPKGSYAGQVGKVGNKGGWGQLVFTVPEEATNPSVSLKTLIHKCGTGPVWIAVGPSGSAGQYDPKIYNGSYSDTVFESNWRTLSYNLPGPGQYQLTFSHDGSCYSHGWYPGPESQWGMWVDDVRVTWTQ